MTVFQGLGDFLMASAEITALAGARLYAGRLPQKVEGLTASTGAIVLTLVSNPRQLHLRGPINLSKARWQIDCWAPVLDVALELGSLCRWRLHGYAGTWLDAESPANTIDVRVIEQDNEQLIPEAEILGGLYRHSTDYLITYAASEDRVLI